MPSLWAAGLMVGSHQEDSGVLAPRRTRWPRVGGWLCPAGGLRVQGAGRGPPPTPVQGLCLCPVSE